MSTVISSSVTGASTEPTLVLGYVAERVSRNIVHPLAGGGIVVSVIAPNYRSGTLELFYETEAAAFFALELHATPGQFHLASSDRPSLDMFYVLGEDSLEIALDEDTRELWVVSVPFQEVSPT